MDDGSFPANGAKNSADSLHIEMNNNKDADRRIGQYLSSESPLANYLSHTDDHCPLARIFCVLFCSPPQTSPEEDLQSKILRNTPRRCDSEPALALSTQCALGKLHCAPKCTKSRSLVTAPNHAYKNLRFVWHEKTAQLAAMHLGSLGEACLGGRCKCADLSESHLLAEMRTIIGAHVLPRH